MTYDENIKYLKKQYDLAFKDKEYHLWFGVKKEPLKILYKVAVVCFNQKDFELWSEVTSVKRAINQTVVYYTSDYEGIHYYKVQSEKDAISMEFDKIIETHYAKENAHYKEITKCLRGAII